MYGFIIFFSFAEKADFKVRIFSSWLWQKIDEASYLRAMQLHGWSEINHGFKAGQKEDLDRRRVERTRECRWIKVLEFGVKLKNWYSTNKWVESCKGIFAVRRGDCGVEFSKLYHLKKRVVFNIFLIGEQMLYNIVLISAIQQSESAICVYTSCLSGASLLPHPISLSSRSPQRRAELPVL